MWGTKRRNSSLAGRNLYTTADTARPEERVYGEYCSVTASGEWVSERGERGLFFPVICTIYYMGFIVVVCVVKMFRILFPIKQYIYICIPYLVS